MKGVRQIDIARRLGLSKMAVSKALRDHTDIAPATRERVQRIAQQMNYRPNRVARSLANRRSRTLGVVVPKISHLFYAEALAGIQAAASLRGFEIIVCVSEEDPEREIAQLETLISMQVEGLLVASAEEPAADQAYQSIADVGIPLIFFDRHPRRTALSRVTMDDRAAAALVTEALISEGSHRLALLGASADLNIGFDRRAGFEEAHATRGLRVNTEWTIEGGFSEEDGRRGFFDLWESGARPDGLVAVSFPVALGVRSAMMQIDPQLATRIPVATFGNASLNRHLRYPCVCVEQPVREMGRRAVTLLLDASETLQSNPQRIELAPLGLDGMNLESVA